MEFMTMSTPLVSEENPEISQWDSFTHLYDEPNGNIDLSSLDWTLDSAKINNSSLATTCTLTLGKKSESPDFPSEKTAQHNSESKLKTRSKERTRTSRAKGDQTAVERRRNQVRLAQQAYRHRKEEHAISLRREIDDLKRRLIGMERVCDELFTIVSLSDLPEKFQGSAENLCLSAQQYRLSPEMRAAAKAKLPKANRSDKDVSNASLPNFSENILDIGTNLYRSDLQLAGNQGLIQIFPPNSPMNYPPKVSGLLQSQKSPQSNIEPNIRQLGDIPKSAMTFSMWLRYESLKGAYTMVTNQETPYALLCRAFRYCLFTSTREQIMTHVRHLIHETLKQANQASSTPVTISEKTLPRENYSILEADKFSTVTVKSEFNQSYMSPEEVDKYLSERGLKVDPSSSYVTFKLTRSVTTPTLFEDICQGKEMKISVRRLLHELQNRMVCLVVGPGILVSEIDDAIRSTVLAGI